MNKILILIFSFCMTCYLCAAPFDEVTEGHWAYDALAMLEEKGFVEGYPDGLFKGDRPVSRYEMAMIVARVLAKLEQIQASLPEMPALSICAAKKDLETINKLLKEFRSELDALGIRESNVEASLSSLVSRVEEMEKVKVSGNFNSTSVSIGYYPDEKNISSFGNPFPPSPTPGPVIIYDRDRFNGLNGGNRLFSGSAIMTQINLTVSTKISENIKAGGDFSAYSAFGEQGVIDQWGLLPAYNSSGQIVSIYHFQANVSTLWFDTDGNWDITGKFGDYNLKKVSPDLFSGLRNNISYAGKELQLMNGINICGNLYRTIDMEIFMARNINLLRTSESTGVPGKFRYELAAPYNDGAGVYRLFSYGAASPGQYDNYLEGLWAGHDFQEGKAHIEGAFLRLFENYASNPSLGVDNHLTAPPKEAIYYGFKGYYKFPEDKINIYGEFNQTRFDYNLLDNKSSYTGSFLKIGTKVKLDNINFYGEFLRIDPNYDPLNYHQSWDKISTDIGGAHEGWGWKDGIFACNGRRFSRTRPNRMAIDLGLNFKFGEKQNGIIYANFAYMQQVKPTAITNDEDSFQSYDFLTGLPVANKTGINIYGNGDHFFTENDPSGGKEYTIEFGGRYFTDKFHTWGYFEYHNFNRDYETKNYDTDISYTFACTGVTYDITDKFSAQGFVEYVKCSGVNEFGKDVKWSQLVPGMGLKYSFNNNTEFQVDYKLYDYTTDTIYDTYDKVPDVNNNSNNYMAQKLMTRLVIKF